MKYDVIVVGGGPAGSVTARHCAKAGLETVILEKEYFPRPKPCAGGVSMATAELLGVAIPPEVIEARCSTFNAYYAGKHIQFDLEKDFMVVVTREVFDLWLVSLAQSAGAELRQGEKVLAVDVDDTGVRVRTAAAVYSGRLVIGADGVNSTVAKMIRKPFKKRELAFCLCSDAPAVEQANHWREGVEIHYNAFPMSYSWIFPRKGCRSIGSGGWLSGFNNEREILERFLHDWGGSRELRVRGMHIPLGGIHRPTVGERVILVGDAAGYADPFTGEGIRYAIASGRQAAAAVSALFKQGITPNRLNLGTYERDCYLDFGAELKTALFIARLFHQYPKALLGMYFSCREPFEKSMEILQGEMGYRQLYRWLLWHVPGLLRHWAVKESATEA